MTSEVHTLLQFGELENLKNLIKNGANIYNLNHEGNCALAVAMFYDYDDVAMELLSQYERDLKLIDSTYKGLVYIAVDDEEITSVLHWINSTKDDTCIQIKILLRNSGNTLNKMVDVYMSNKNHLSILNKLHKNGFVDIFVKNLNDKTLLDIAVDKNKVNVVKNLLQLQTIRGQRFAHFMDVFQQAVWKGHCSIVDELTKYVRLDCLTSFSKDTLLHAAANSSNEEVFNMIFNLLINYEISLDKSKQKSDIIKQMLEVTSDDHCQSTLLHILIKKNMENVVIDLLEHNLKLDSVTKCGDSLLNYAIEADSLKLVQLLITLGVNVLERYSNSQTNALIKSGWYGSFAIFEEIITACPKHIFVQGSNDCIETLFGSIHTGSILKVKLLLHLGVDINTCFDGSNSLIEAVWSNDLDMVKFILENLETDASGKCIYLNSMCTTGNSPLSLSINSTNSDIFKYLLKMGVDINLTPNNGWSALHAACYFGNHEIIAILLQNGADRNQINNKGNLPIQTVIDSGSYKSFKILFNDDLDLNLRDRNGNTLLMLAAKIQNCDICNDILKAGAEVNAVNFDNNTALHFAGDLDVINILVKYGANLMALNSCGNTPYLEVTSQWAYNPQYLKNHLNFNIDYSVINKNNQNMLHFVLPFYKDTLSELFQHPKFNTLISYSGRDIRGWTLLLIACYNNDLGLPLFKRIYEFGSFNLNSKNYDGFSAMYQLIYKNKIEILDFVLSKGANVNENINAYKETPIISATEMKNIEAVKLIIKYGADVNAQDERGFTAMHKAVQNGRLDIACLLIENGADLHLEDFVNKRKPLEYDNAGCIAAFMTPFL